MKFWFLKRKEEHKKILVTVFPVAVAGIMKSLNNNVSLLTKGDLYFVIKSSVSNPDSGVLWIQGLTKIYTIPGK